AGSGGAAGLRRADRRRGAGAEVSFVAIASACWQKIIRKVEAVSNEWAMVPDEKEAFNRKNVVNAPHGVRLYSLTSFAVGAPAARKVAVWSAGRAASPESTGWSESEPARMTREPV